MRTIIRDNYTPQLGQYHERIIIDSVNEKVWLFDCDGVFTDITRVIVENEYGEHANHAISQKFFTDEVQKIAKDLDDETAARIAADADLDERKQDKLTAGDGIVLEDNVISADLVQTIGQGADKIMSQKAVTDTLFADNNQNKIQIGGVSSSAGFSTAIGGFSEADTYGVAIGHSANAAQDSVALGYGSVASESNTVSVGSQVNERRIVNVADPVNDQDAATKNYVDAADASIQQDISGLGDRIDAVESKIPSAATAQNQLADKNFVNSSIATNTAYYISDNGQPFSSLADLQNYSGTLTNNDYAFVVGTDQQGNTTYTRYKYNADTQQWAEEYVLNNSSFTANQWAAINSGITSGDVTKLSTLANIQTIGANLTLTNGELSATDTTYTAGANVQISAENVISATDTTYSVMTGATSSTAGASGLVPQPLVGDQDKYLKGDGTWATAQSGGQTTVFWASSLYASTATLYSDQSLTTAVTGQQIVDALEVGPVIIQFGSSPTQKYTVVSSYYYSQATPLMISLLNVGSVGGEVMTTVFFLYYYGSSDTTADVSQSMLQPYLIAGSNITISGNRISATVPTTNNINSTDWSALWQ